MVHKLTALFLPWRGGERACGRDYYEAEKSQLVACYDLVHSMCSFCFERLIGSRAVDYAASESVLPRVISCELVICPVRSSVWS